MRSSVASRRAGPRPACRVRRSLARRPPAQAELWWRLRVKDADGNRTRVVALAAPSRDEAIARALVEIGGGWEVLEAKLAPAEPKARA
jgi:hypothetical protein